MHEKEDIHKTMSDCPIITQDELLRSSRFGRMFLSVDSVVYDPADIAQFIQDKHVEEVKILSGQNHTAINRKVWETPEKIVGRLSQGIQNVILLNWQMYLFL